MLSSVPRGEEIHLPHLDVEVVDPTGAGDALITTLTILLCAGRSLFDAARLASAAAAHTVSHLGGRPVVTAKRT
jgi:ribokinase